jgi:tetratricopeptide (TPR) repeat protein
MFGAARVHSLIRIAPPKSFVYVRAMSLRLRCSALLLMLCLGWAGCSPVAETQLDEQKNPHYQAGKQKLSALDYKGAIESFERATEDNPRSALAHYELGVLFDQHENDYAAALYHYNKAVKLRPNGYPADNIRLRIPACKQELVKADSLAVINPSALRETERLREENAALRKQLEMLQSHLAARPPTATPVNPAASASAGATRPVSSVGSGVSTPSARPVTGSTGQTAGSGATDRARSTMAAGRYRNHSVKPGDTPSSIARQYQIKLSSLLSANPGLDAKRMRVGQILYVPAS